jgi:hypothetical protein
MCSRKCQGEYFKTSMIGENNPNFGKKWPDERRKAFSVKTLARSNEISKRVTEDWKENDKRRQKASEVAKRTIGLYRREPGFTVSEETKILIGKKSSEKFTFEFKKSFRKTMEDNEHWIPLHLKTDKELYYKESSWVSGMFDLVDDEKNLLKENGVFNNTLNTKGVVRDHIMGRIYGFRNGIFPELLRHPANCRIILHSENVSKGQKGKGRADTDISIEELFDLIINYKKEWFEQDKCVFLIEEYKNGKRWKRKEV